MTDSPRDGAQGPVPAAERHKELYQLLHVRLHQLIDGKLPEHTAWDHCDFRIWADDLERLVSGYFEAALPHAPSPQDLEKRINLSLRLGQILGPDYDGVPLEDVARELVTVKAQLAAAHAPSPPTRQEVAALIHDIEQWQSIYGDGGDESDVEVLLIEAKRLLRKRFAAPSPPTGWQPIETAPKDGTHLILWSPTELEAVHAWWQHGDGRAHTPCWASFGGRIVLNPTGWMRLPLPAPVAPHEDTP